MKNLAEIAFYELYPEKPLTRQLRVKYSKAFRSYNANVKYTNAWMEFKLSSDWEEVSDEMKIGLIQNLMIKVFKDKRKTINMDLYENFVKGIGEYRPATEADPILIESFKRVNEKYLGNLIEMPNLVWGQRSFTKLGMYTYADNTITLSTVLAEDEELLDYVMYHEMLHKKHKYTTKNGRSHHHTKAFRDEERLFANPNVEHKLQEFLRRKKWAENFKGTKAKKQGADKRTLFEWFFG